MFLMLIIIGSIQWGLYQPNSFFSVVKCCRVIACDVESMESKKSYYRNLLANKWRKSLKYLKAQTYLLCYVPSSPWRLWLSTTPYILSLLAGLLLLQSPALPFHPPITRYVASCLPVSNLLSICPVSVNFSKPSFLGIFLKKFHMYFPVAVFFLSVFSLKRPCCLHPMSRLFLVSFCSRIFLLPILFLSSVGTLSHIHCHGWITNANSAFFSLFLTTFFRFKSHFLAFIFWLSLAHCVFGSRRWIPHPLVKQFQHS